VALRAVPDHPKFAHFKVSLKLTKGAALGYLEALWHFCGRFTPRGDIGRYSNEDIEAWVEWDGVPGSLIAALTDAGWLDVDPEHRLLVHDWAKYADDATKIALKRARLSFIVPRSRIDKSPTRPDIVPTSSRYMSPPQEPEKQQITPVELRDLCRAMKIPYS